MNRLLIATTGLQSWFNRPSISIISKAIAPLLAVALGLVSAIVGSFFADKPVAALAIPIVLVSAILFLLDSPSLFLFILVSRAAADPIFESSKAAGAGVGGLVNVATILVLFAMLISKRRRASLEGLGYWGPLLCIATVSLAYSPSLADALRLYLSLLSYAAVFCMARAVASHNMSRNGAMQLIVASSLIPVAYTFVLIAMGKGGVAGRIEDVSEGFRVAGAFTHPNILAFYLLTVISAILYRNSAKGGKAISTGWKIVSNIYLVLLIGLLGATKTRSAWLGCALLLLVFGFLVDRRYLIVIVAVGVAALLTPEVRDRLSDLAAGNEYRQWAKLNSYAWRKLLWSNGIDWMSPSSYLLGNGYESFRFYSPDFFQLAGGVGWGAHSVYVQAFFEWGVAGIVAMIFLFFRTAQSVYLTRDKNNKTTWLVALGLLFAYILACYSDNMLSYLVVNWYFWFFLGSLSITEKSVPD